MQLNDGSRDLVTGVDFIPRQPASPCDQRHRNLVTLDATNREMLNLPSSAALVGDYFLNQKDVILTLVEPSSGVICKARGRTVASRGRNGSFTCLRKVVWLEST